MKPLQDPPRLLDPGSDAPAWLRSALEPGARDVAGPDRLARIAALLPSGPVGSGSSDPSDPETHGSDPSDVPPAAPPPPAVPPVAPALPSMLSGAAIGAALGLAVVTVGWLASPRAVEAPSLVRQAPSVAVTTAVAEPLRLAPSKSPAPRVHPLSERPEPLPGGTGAPAASVAPALAADAPASGPEGSPSGEGVEPGAESERAILERAQDALRGSPARALALTDRHLARFPGGVLAQEREVLAISALLGMGRAAEARARAARFVAVFPTSAHRRRLAVLIPDLESSGDVHKDPSDPPSTP